MRERATLVKALSDAQRKEAVGFLRALGGYVYDEGIDIGKDAAILLAHRFLRALGGYVYDEGIDIGKDAAILLAHRFLELSGKP
jgi:hypothetical protein